MGKTPKAKTVKSPVAIPDADFESLKGTLNTTIHEIVFACQLMDDDQVEDALNALMTAQGNLDDVSTRLVALTS